MGLLKIEALAETPLQTDPYEYVVVENFLDQADQAQILGGFPEMPDAGSFPLSELEVGPGLQALFDALDGPAFRKAVEQKFGLDLHGRATMFTLRGRCDTRDGRIHTDSKKKIITVLLYLNEGWNEDGGRLRLLRNGEDLNCSWPPRCRRNSARSWCSAARRIPGTATSSTSDRARCCR
jgi:hypothetical protein